MGKAEKINRDFTSEEFNKYLPSLSVWQIDEFRRIKTEQNSTPESESKVSTPDPTPLKTFINNISNLPKGEYREIFARRHLSGVLIEGEPLDLSHITKPQKDIPTYGSFE